MRFQTVILVLLSVFTAYILYSCSANRLFVQPLCRRRNVEEKNIFAANDGKRA